MSIGREIKEEQYRSASESLLRLHSLFGIFLVYDDKLSRPKRFIIYYLKIHLLLAITGLFS